MNAADVCHEVQDCPGLYVDAFRGRYLRRTQDPNNAFILTHYHGDHYQNLQRDGKYKGPALIHCTPVTAALLTQIHQVPYQYLVEHEYGQSFDLLIKGRGEERTKITFYDANHCPGACIVLIQLPDGTTHLHTGDMRYHQRFQSYPLLQEAVANKKLDIVYLDTTYCHPKHDFVAQDEAIQTIADQTEELLGSKGNSSGKPPATKTLVLLSCYSIGKEKVLWEAATRTNQLVYVSEKKLRMLQCVQQHESQEVSSQIIHRCTLDATKSDVHVIPMGLAGEVWPFFRPNFLKCAKYTQELETTYDKVVAFLPTGWAHGSKWNREHAVNQKMVPRDDEGKEPLHVEVRLVPYSEHSTYSELVAFVQYLRPRKVVPTVFGDDAEYRKIEDRFRNLLDSTRAKKVFFRSMTRSSASTSPLISDQKNCEAEKMEGSSRDSKSTMGTPVEDDEVIEIFDDETQFPKTHCSPVTGPFVHPEHVESLTAMGFSRSQAQQALHDTNGHFESAIEHILAGHYSAEPCESSKRKHGNSMLGLPKESSSAKKKARSPGEMGCADITSFFAKRPHK